MRIGSPPRTDRLPTLTTGVSRPADVLVVLGEPRGRGVMRPWATLTPRTIWSYEYGEFEATQMKLKILLVFFAQDRYDGYLWFASDSPVLGEVAE